MADEPTQALPPPPEEPLPPEIVAEIEGIGDEILPSDVAASLTRLPSREATRAFERIPDAAAARVLDRMESAKASEILLGVEPARAARLLASMDAAEAAELLRELRGREREGLLAALPPEERTRLARLLGYPPGSAGGLMTDRVVAFPDDATCGGAAQVLRRVQDRSRIPTYAYVADAAGRLRGVVSMRDLLLSEPGRRLASLVRRAPVAVRDTDPVARLAEVFRRHRFLAVPVTDAEGRLLGLVAIDDVLEASERGAREDAQIMVGAGPRETVHTPWARAFRSRHPWLQFNLLTAFAAGATVALFEGFLGAHAKVAAFLPVVAGQAGNTGLQALSVVLQGIALGEVASRGGARIVAKEAGLGLANGFLVSAVAAGAMILYTGRADLAAVTAVSMTAAMGLAGGAGAGIPLLMHRVGRDPAQASAILLTTVTDVTSLLFFLGLARLLLGLAEP